MRWSSLLWIRVMGSRRRSRKKYLSPFLQQKWRAEVTAWGYRSVARWWSGMAEPSRSRAPRRQGAGRGSPYACRYAPGRNLMKHETARILVVDDDRQNG